MNTTIDITALRKQIQEQKEILKKQEEALLILEGMVAQTVGTVPTKVTPAIPLVQEKDVDQGRVTLKDKVAIATTKLAGRVFTSGDVLDTLKQDGVEISGDNPKSRVAVLLSKLESDGKVVKTFTGSGQVPHQYKIVPPESAGLI